MTNKKPYLILPLLLAFSSFASAASLVDVYGQAQTTNPGLRAADATRQATLQALPQTRALLLPDIGFVGDVARDRFDDRTSGGDVSYATNKNYSLQLSQAVYRRDRWIQYRQADSRILQAEAEYAAQEQELILQVSTAYFTVLGATDNLDFAVSERKSIARQLDQAKQRFDVGLIAITDVHEAQARYDLAVAREIDAENLLENAKEALREISGQHYDDLNILGESMPLIKPDPESPADWVRTALDQNPEYQAAKAAAETARQEVDIQYAGHHPTLDLRSSFVRRDQSFGGFIDQERDDTEIGLQLNVPIYKGGLTTALTREASFLYEQARETQEQQRRATERQMRDSYRGVMSGISLVTALKQALVSTQTALEAAEAGFDVGTRTIVDVLDAQRELFRARRDYARARYDYLLNTLRMKQASGALMINDLKLINGWLTNPATP